MENVYINRPSITESELFHLTVIIKNMEIKLERKISTEHPYYKKKVEWIIELSNLGMNEGDFIALDKQANQYIELHK
tara:strand:+ start:762 stop:992 length:231 start_codon:yes stop_codon:yes gene_type:complete